MQRVDRAGRGAGNPALAALAHPAALAAAAVLLLNDFVWQRLWPSWWTGKLGDVAWLVIAPLLLAVPLGWVRPLRRLSPRAFAALICLPVALAFTLAKAGPAINAALLALGVSLGLALKLRLDPTDLLALPGVLLALWIWHSSLSDLAYARSRERARVIAKHPFGGASAGYKAAALALAALAVLADSAAPIDSGIKCLTNTGAAVLAVREMFQSSESPFSDSSLKSVYRSEDGGLTWRPDPQTDAKKLTCIAATPWPIADPSNPKAQLFYVPGQGVYRSADQGRSLQLEQAFQNLDDYELDPASHTLIVAAGTDGIWVKTPTGQWQQTLNLKPATPTRPQPTAVLPKPTTIQPRPTATPSPGHPGRAPAH
jgi:hypothetical protein